MLALADPTNLDTFRLRGEFVDMPGLVINGSQVARLLGLRSQRATELLDELETEGFLTQLQNGSYRRAYPMSA